MTLYLQVFDLAWWTMSRVSTVMWWVQSRKPEQSPEHQLMLTNQKLKFIERELNQLYAFQTKQAQIIENINISDDVVIVSESTPPSPVHNKNELP